MPRKRKPRKLRDPYWLPYVDDSITDKILGPRLLGQCFPDGRIEMERRLPSRKYLETLVHELLHRHLPMCSEEWVEDTALRISNAIWSRDFRRIEEE